MHSREVVVESVPSDARGQVDFGLVIGVDHYPRFRSLTGAIADATRFHEWMCDPDGGGVDRDHSRLILSRPEPAAPLQEEIDEAFVELLTIARSHGCGHRLYFHFSGHGSTCPEKSADDVALLLARWSQTMARVALSTDDYRSEIHGLGLFDELAIFLDCCRSTSVSAVGLPPSFTVPIAAKVATRAFIAYASEAGRSAFEVPAEDGWQGIFTRSLLTILRRSPDGIAAEQLKRELEREVAGRGQRAHVVNGFLPSSHFGRRGRLPRLEITFGAQQGRVWLLDGMNRQVEERAAGPEPWVLELPAGLYKLEFAAQPAVLIDHGRAEVTHVVL